MAVPEGDVAKFARELRGMLGRDGERALDRCDWARRFVELGFEMDCGRSFEERYDLRLGDAHSLASSVERIDDVRVLGNAAFSECRYLTHWAMGPDDEGLEWLRLALGHLEKLG